MRTANSKIYLDIKHNHVVAQNTISKKKKKHRKACGWSGQLIGIE